ncbi:uncharacterized protein HaLaN_08807 [Haematococcus lacustris]|uniref:GYF domain-containing protein n=1 Tax=Haematococcus lacustris TaxID=44745 RepID=A0A699Z1W8_HAELA|nr:uncharacterized protein HaLaN_08807 [Haematococcus lacustris]
MPSPICTQCPQVQGTTAHYQLHMYQASWHGMLCFLELADLAHVCKAEGVRREEHVAARLRTEGRKGEYALSSCWWYMDSASGPVYGPFSCEQMLLACFANGLRRSTWVCGTTHELAPPLAPKASQFKPLHELIQWCSRESTASYTLITPKDVRVAG